MVPGMMGTGPPMICLAACRTAPPSPPSTAERFVRPVAVRDSRRDIRAPAAVVPARRCNSESSHRTAVPAQSTQFGGRSLERRAVEASAVFSLCHRSMMRAANKSFPRRPVGPSWKNCQNGNFRLKLTPPEPPGFTPPEPTFKISPAFRMAPRVHSGRVLVVALILAAAGIFVWGGPLDGVDHQFIEELRMEVSRLVWKTWWNFVWIQQGGRDTSCDLPWAGSMPRSDAEGRGCLNRNRRATTTRTSLFVSRLRSQTTGPSSCASSCQVRAVAGGGCRPHPGQAARAEFLPVLPDLYH